MKVNKRNKRVVIYQRSPDPRERTHFPASRSGIITPRSFHSQSSSIANIYQLNLKSNLKEHRHKTKSIYSLGKKKISNFIKLKRVLHTDINIIRHFPIIDSSQHYLTRIIDLDLKPAEKLLKLRFKLIRSPKTRY